MKAELRFMTDADLQITYAWRNDPLVRHMAMSDHEISYAEHEAMYKYNNALRLIFEFNGEPSGFVSCTVDPESNDGVWSFHLAPEARGQGLAPIMLRLALMFLKQRGYKRIKSEIKVYNGRSFNLHLDLGFKQDLEEDPLADYHNLAKDL